MEYLTVVVVRFLIGLKKQVSGPPLRRRRVNDLKQRRVAFAFFLFC